MMFLVLEIESEQDDGTRKTVKAWINTFDKSDAVAKAADYLSRQQWALLEVLDCSVTDKTDYFAPCTSLDAFLRAEEHGAEVLFG